MESKRQQKFAGMLQKELADIFLKEGSAYLPNTLVTITRVRVSPDLAIARVYLSFLNNTNAQAMLNTVQGHMGEIRYKLGSRIRHQVRGIPELHFFVDDTNSYVERMDAIFSQIAKEEGEA